MPVNIHAVAGSAYGTPVALGVLVSTGTAVDNADTAVPFTIPANSTLTLQATGEGYFKVGTAATVEATTAADGSSFHLAQHQSVTFVMPDGYTHISWIGSTTNCKVFRNLT